MKRTLLLIPVLLFACSEPEPEVDWDAVDREITVIEDRLDTCLDTAPPSRHVAHCYNRAVIKLEELARKYDIDLDE